MPIITFWTEIEKETGQTSAAIAVATHMAIDHNKRILLFSTNNNNELELAFWNQEKKKRLFSFLEGGKKVGIDTGVEGLVKAASSNKLTPNMITNYTKIVFKDRLEVLQGYNGPRDEYKKMKRYYMEIIQKASQYYDVVIVDLNKQKNDFTQEIIEASDIIVYGITQKSNAINTYLESKMEGFVSQKKNIVTYIGRYDSFSKYSSKNLSRLIKQRDKLCPIPYNTLFGEACDEGNVADYFLKMKTVKGTDRNAEFLKDIKELSDSILYKIQELQMRM